MNPLPIISRHGPPPLPIAVAGAGRAGGALVAALVRREVTRLRVWDRQKERASRLCRRLDVEFSRTPEDLVRGARTLIVAVPDDAVTTAATRLVAAIEHTGWKGLTVALHLAGALSSEAIAPLRGSEQTAVGVFHPVVSLQGAESASTLPGSYATISGDRAAVAAGRRLARTLAMRPLTVADGDRPLMHLAAVLAAGDTIALLDEARALLEGAGIAEDDARDLVASLARGAVDAFARRGAGAALTGPAARGDAHTLASHLDALAAAGHTGRRVDRLHRDLALASAEIARRAGRLTADQLEVLRRALER